MRKVFQIYLPNRYDNCRGIDVRDRCLDLLTLSAVHGQDWQEEFAIVRNRGRGVLRCKHFQSATTERAPAWNWSAGVELCSGFLWTWWAERHREAR
jgi:hypothetical protein